MKHARAWAASSYPGSLSIEAHAKLVWIPDGDGDGGRFPRSVEEDIWNVFDLLVFPINPVARVHCLQVTTATGGKTSNSAARRRKIGKWIPGAFPNGPPVWLGTIAVIAWVPRKHFRWWNWNWHLQDWVESPVVLAPLPKVSPRKSDTDGAAPQSLDAHSVFD